MAPPATRSPFSGRFFFTPVGFAALVLVLALFVRSLSARNAYEITLSAAALLFLLVIGFTGAWKARRFAAFEAAWKPPFPFTAAAGGEIAFSGIELPVQRFFRFHFSIRGHFFPAASRHGCPVFAETSVSSGESAARIPLSFPMSGVFHGGGFYRLRDIFGFFSFRCALPQYKMVHIRSAPYSSPPFLLNAHCGAEDRRNKSSSDTERYYMREYSPGDLSRDINWKSSLRIDSLVTRIAPENQEKVNRLEVYFRNYGSADYTALDALWLLDRAKARLSRFLRGLKELQANYVFEITSAGASWTIEDTDQLDEFFEELAGVPFYPPRAESAAGSGELFVFSTACDTGLSAFLLACQSRPVSLFLVNPASHGKAAGNLPDTEILRLGSFAANGCIPPLRRFFSAAAGRAKTLPLNPAAVKADVSYAAVRLL